MDTTENQGSIINQRICVDPGLDFLRPTAVDDLVRLGADCDGGYVISQRCMDHASALLSLGIGDDWSFDRDWNKLKPQDRIHAYDGTMDWQSLGNVQHSNFLDFWRHPKIHFPINIASCSSGTTQGLDRALSVLDCENIFVKIDIEGGEWNLVNYLCSNNPTITGMVIEFHDIGRLRDWFIDCVNKLSRYFDIVHLHGNNTCFQCDDGLPSVIELSFCHKRLLPSTNVKRSDIYLHDLDRPNLATLPDIELFFKN